jgi:hypothetical protein
MKMLHRVVLAVGAAAVALMPALATNSWGGYHWAGDGRNLELTVNRANTAQWTTAVSGAIADWEKSRELSFTSKNVSGVNTKRCPPIAGQILVCNDAYGQRGWLGLATIWLSSGHIVQGLTQLNDTYFNMAFYNTDAWRALVACQEIGHDFGLDHQDENFNNVNLGTCEDYTNAPAGGVYNGFDYGPSNEHPNAHDYDQISLIYNHDDGYTSATAGTNFGIRQVGQRPLGTEPPGLSMAEWGRAVGTDAQGRPNEFVKDLGAGQRMVTHVFWAVGERAR